MLSNTLETLNGFAWSGLTYLLLMAGGETRFPGWMLLVAALLFAATIALLLAAWILRRRED